MHKRIVTLLREITFLGACVAGAQWFGAASFGVAVVFGALLLKDVNSNASELARSQVTPPQLQSAQAPDLSVAWVLSQRGASMLNDHGQFKPLADLPLALHTGQQIRLEKGGQLRTIIFNQATIRQFEGPATLNVIKDTISLASGPAAKVFAAQTSQIDIAQSWVHQHGQNFSQLQAGAVNHVISTSLKGASPNSQATFHINYPVNGAVLLTRKPEFSFTGVLPKDGTLIIYRPDGSRHWVQTVESLNIVFPPAAIFDWGQTFTWEVRKRTGGRILEGKFSIASEKQAFDLISAKVPALPHTPAEDLLFYAMRLHLAGAYREAREVMAQFSQKH